MTDSIEPNSGMKVAITAIEKAVYELANRDGWPTFGMNDFTKFGLGFFELTFSGQTLLVEVSLSNPKDNPDNLFVPVKERVWYKEKETE